VRARAAVHGLANRRPRPAMGCQSFNRIIISRFAAVWLHTTCLPNSLSARTRPVLQARLRCRRRGRRNLDSCKAAEIVGKLQIIERQPPWHQIIRNRQTRLSLTQRWRQVVADMGPRERTRAHGTLKICAALMIEGLRSPLLVSLEERAR
jgi:hypothetical protein